jgi:hypothetical protein
MMLRILLHEGMRTVTYRLVPNSEKNCRENKTILPYALRNKLDSCLSNELKYKKTFFLFCMQRNICIIN